MENSNASRQMVHRLMGTILQRRNFWLGAILLIALLGFESFNYSTTFTALNDLLGEMRFASIRWATILALAFSAIDFAGIARLFSDDTSESGGKEAWFLFIAWLLAATMNAILTWWGVSLALVNHSMASTNMIDPNLLMRAVPIFVAIMVWVTRILLISTISVSGTRFITGEVPRALSTERGIVPVQTSSAPRPRPTQSSPAPLPVSTRTMRQNASAQRSAPPEPAPRPAPTQARSAAPEPAPRPNVGPARNSTPAPGNVSRPAASPPRNGQPNPASRPQQQRPQPPNNRGQRPQNTPPPPPPPPVDDDFELEEPEYIPDPNYLPANSPYHSLSARSKNNGGTRQ